MARRINILTAKEVSNASTPGYLFDGAGLYLQVANGGSKSWVLRYTVNKRPREMGLGSTVTFTLAEARVRAAKFRQMIADGLDPIDERKNTILAKRMAEANVITFDKAAEKYIAANKEGWRNAKHEAQWRSTLATYASPVIGGMSVATIETGHVLRILEPIWTVKTETATRVRGRIEKVLDWAKVQGYRAGDNPAAWKGHLSEALPKPSKVANEGHHAALPWADIAAFMAELQSMPGVAARALEMIILCASRTSEVLNAQWQEIDLDGAVWTVPADRMKSFKPHRVPLSAPVLQLLRKLPQVDAYVFPGAKEGTALSNMSCLAVLKRMNRADLTVHGFRSTFRDWVSECTAYPRDVAEMALAHAIADNTEAAYRRGDLLEKRRALMADWANYCATPRSDNVVHLSREAA